MSGRAMWIVLGASSAIGQAFARHVAQLGCDVLLAGRCVEALQAIAADLRVRYDVQAQIHRIDLVKLADVLALTDACLRAFQTHTCHVFVCVGTMVPPETPMARQQLFQVNVTHIAEWLTQMQPLLQRQAKGHVVVLGSVAGDRGRAKHAFYGAAKAGLHAFMQSYRALLYPYGVTVTTIKPGYVDTAMTYGLPGLFAVATPEVCAVRCYRAAMQKKPICYVPGFWRWIMTMVCCLPERLMQSMRF